VTDTRRPEASRPPLLQRIARCFSVSVLTTLISLCVLTALAFGLGVRAWLANVVATAVGTVPSYVLNRRWVWGRRGASDPWREVMPFWAMSFAGLVLSTVAVDAADALARDLAVGQPLHMAVLLAANVGSFGALWVAQFVVLDRVLFGRPSPARWSRDESDCPASVRPVQRLCERPDCDDPASVSYGFDAASRMLWLDVLGPQGPAAGVLCQRHADAMRLPKGWWLQDRRADQALFPADATTTTKRPSAYRVRRPRNRMLPSERLPIEADDVVSAAGAPAVPAWSPDFDPSDDLGGMLDAKTPLLARAFGRPVSAPAD
jgi:putative flippase GtrA